MRDITSIIMGDPGTHPRRSPTEREMAEWKQLTSHEQRKSAPSKSSSIANPEDFERVYTCRRKARNAQNSLTQRGFRASMKKIDEVTYLVRGLRY